MGSSVLDVFNDKYPSSNLIGCGPSVNLKIADLVAANNKKHFSFKSPITTSAHIKNSYVPRSEKETSERTLLHMFFVNLQIPLH